MEEEVDRDRESGISRIYNWPKLALCLSTADPWPGSMSWTARHSGEVRGIERGIKLPLKLLANGTGEKVICHCSFSSSVPASGEWSRGAWLRHYPASILLVGHEACGKCLVVIKRLAGHGGCQIRIWSCLSHGENAKRSDIDNFATICVVCKSGHVSPPMIS